MTDHRVGSRSLSQASIHSAADVEMTAPAAADATEEGQDDDVFVPDFGGPDDDNASGGQSSG